MAGRDLIQAQRRPRRDLGSDWQPENRNAAARPYEMVTELPDEHCPEAHVLHPQNALAAFTMLRHIANVVNFCLDPGRLNNNSMFGSVIHRMWLQAMNEFWTMHTR